MKNEGAFTFVVCSPSDSKGPSKFIVWVVLFVSDLPSVGQPGMDFDDLDDEIEKRVQDGEEVACHVVENQQPVKGTVLRWDDSGVGLGLETGMPWTGLDWERRTVAAPVV